MDTYDYLADPTQIDRENFLDYDYMLKKLFFLAKNGIDQSEFSQDRYVYKKPPLQQELLGIHHRREKLDPDKILMHSDVKLKKPYRYNIMPKSVGQSRRVHLNFNEILYGDDFDLAKLTIPHPKKLDKSCTKTKNSLDLGLCDFIKIEKLVSDQKSKLKAANKKAMKSKNTHKSLLNLEYGSMEPKMLGIRRTYEDPYIQRYYSKSYNKYSKII